MQTQATGPLPGPRSGSHERPAPGCPSSRRRDEPISLPSLNAGPHPLPTLKTWERATVAQDPVPGAPGAPARPFKLPGASRSQFAPPALTKSRVGARARFLRRSGRQDKGHQSGQEEEPLPHVPVRRLSGEPSPLERSGSCSHREGEAILPALPRKLSPPAPPTGEELERRSGPRKCGRRSLRVAQPASGRSRRPPPHTLVPTAGSRVPHSILGGVALPTPARARRHLGGSIPSWSLWGPVWRLAGRQLRAS